MTTQLPMPLEGMTILDATQVMAGPFCTLLLADMGAEVIKIEKPDGDDSRRIGPPFIEGESAAFLGINRNKQSVVLDLRTDAGKAAFKRLAAQVDVVAENYRPGTMARLGLGPEDLRENHPELIYVSVSGFGQTGPYASRPGYDLVAQGMSGMMSVTGYPDSPPVKVSIPIGDLSAGMFAAYGVLSAYIHRLKTGQGQVVETSLLESAIALTVWESAELWGSGQTPQPKGSAHRMVAPYQALATSDGYVNFAIGNQGIWERFCKAIGLDSLIDDPRFASNPTRVQHYQELATELERTTITKTSAEWLTLCLEIGIPAGPIYDMAQVYQDPHVLERGMIQQLQHPIAGLINHIGLPVKMSLTPGQIRIPAPVLGQHTQQVLARHGFTPAEIAELI
ncbi:MAG: CoA transferase [Chloroflexi bacterium]|nr:CoA transferase [Chloroflexota bacterium]